jgi:hypothetical protein
MDIYFNTSASINLWVLKKTDVVPKNNNSVFLDPGMMSNIDFRFDVTQPYKTNELMSFFKLYRSKKHPLSAIFALNFSALLNALFKRQRRWEISHNILIFCHFCVDRRVLILTLT